MAAGAEDKVTPINKAVLNFVFPGLLIALFLEYASRQWLFKLSKIEMKLLLSGLANNTLTARHRHL